MPPKPPPLEKRSKRLTIDEKERIVELKLNRVAVRAIAEAVGCSHTTVQKTWNAYLRQRSAERRADLDLAFEDTISRLERNATDARRGYLAAARDGDTTAAARYLNTERMALTELARLGVVRDDEPAQAARVSAAQATAIAGVLRGVLARAEVPDDARRVILGELAGELRALER